MKKPNFQKLWSAFPDHIKYPDLKTLYTTLGGSCQKNINIPGFGPNGNTCASRLSHALNQSGAPIDEILAKSVAALTLGTEDGSRIIFRVTDLRRYLHKTVGKPTLDKISPFDDRFRGKKGIIAFSVNWQGASGHIALWNGTTYREPQFDNYSTYVNVSHPNIRTSSSEFWELS